MPDQVKGRFFFVVDNIEHFGFHDFRQVFVTCLIDRLVYGEACQFDGLFGAQAIKFNPYIFPGDGIVRDVSAYLVWKEHEPLAALNLVCVRLPFGIVGIERAGAREAEMEEIVVPGGRAEGMGWVALFPSKLV